MSLKPHTYHVARPPPSYVKTLHPGPTDYGANIRLWNDDAEDASSDGDYHDEDDADFADDDDGYRDGDDDCDNAAMTSIRCITSTARSHNDDDDDDH